MGSRMEHPKNEHSGAGIARSVARGEALRAREYEKPEVAVFGEWDTGNLGDRAIHVEAVRFFRECGWRTRSYCLGSLKPATIETATERAVPAALRLRDFTLDRVPSLKRALRQVRQRYRMERLLPELARTDAISVGGGALLSDVNEHFPQSLAVLTEAARMLGKPLWCLGCGSEGSWSPRGEKKLQAFLSACSILAVRDKLTADRIAHVLSRPVPVFGDFCLAEADAHAQATSAHTRHGLALNVCQLPAAWRSEQPRYEEAVVALALRLVRGNELQTVTVFTTGTAEDMVPAHRVFDRLAGMGAELYLPRSLEQLAAIFRGSAITIASRLHAAILAMAEGAPVLGFTPAPKLATFLATMALGEYSFKPGEGARLAALLQNRDCASILAAQRHALRHAPSWVARMQVRKALTSLAAISPPSACT